MTAEEKVRFEKAETELDSEKEKRALDETVHQEVEKLAPEAAAAPAPAAVPVG